MKSMMKRTTYREILQSFGRFFAILAIVALGVGFFTGLKITKQAMNYTVNLYYGESDLYDLHLLSTLGFVEEDIEELSKEEDVRYVEGTYIIDAIYDGLGENEVVLKTHGLPEHINNVDVVSGRLPEQANECVLDSRLVEEDMIGATIQFSSSNDEDTLDLFSETSFTIVGLVDSSYYLNFERGTTSLGTGKVDGFVYLLPEAFDADYYTDVFICFDQDYPIYSDEYETYMEGKSELWDSVCAERVNVRYETILADAKDELDDAREEFEEERQKGEEELTDAYDTLTEADLELETGKAELDSAWSAYYSSKDELNQANSVIEQKASEIREQERSLQAALADLEYKEAELNAQEEQLNSAETALDGQEQQLLLQEMELNKKEDELNQWEELLKQMGPISDENQAQIDASRAEIAAARAVINESKDGITSARQQISDGRTAIADGKLQITAGKEQVNQGLTQIAGADTELTSKQKEIEDGYIRLEAGRQEILQNGNTLEAAQQELSDGWTEYEESSEEFDLAIADAEQELREAEAEIADISYPDYYVLDRGTNIGYVCFENDSEIVNSVAKVFPMFFFLVAALVCMTTMNRMVEEQRTQIGILKALGYGEATIMGKYMFYSGSAALIGCIIGYFGGTYIFPKVIWSTYRMMYELKEIHYIFNWKLAGIALVVSLVCSIGTTWLTCRYELKETAASLMRPKAPKAGKRILLEKIPWIWKRLKFLQKVSARNIFRYKKRFFMMVIGISGCTALLLTGFGLKDSIADFADQQYDNIQIYDGSFVLNDETVMLDSDLNSMVQDYTESYTFVSESTWDLVGEKQVKSIYMLIFAEPDKVTDYMHLQAMNGEAIDYPEAGEAVLSDKMAKNFNVSVGDTILLRNSDMQEIEVTVSGIFENHVYNYVILAPETYIEQMGTAPEYKVLYANFSEDTDSYLASAEIMKQDGVISVTINQDIKDRMTNIMSNLNYVVLLVIICAAALAFIVLYNLTNINITERIREIATIKVLGFFKNETASYVFRENIILTGFGIVVGLLLGILLHRFVMNQINVDLVSFSVYIRPISYIYSIILTFVFNFVVNQVMSIKLEKINMAESLKSVD